MALEFERGKKTRKEQADLARKVGKYIWQILVIKIICISLVFQLNQTMLSTVTDASG